VPPGSLRTMIGLGLGQPLFVVAADDGGLQRMH
jgi:hypothetical protein